MDELMVTSGFNFEGYAIMEYIGFYSGECAFGTGFLSSLDSGVADVPGPNSPVYKEKLLKAKSSALSELKKMAIEHGANAIIGIDIGYTAFSADVMGVIANGTAVRIERVSDGNRMVFNPGNHVTVDGKHVLFPVINYYENLMIRPFRLSFNIVTNKVRLFIRNYGEEKLKAVNVDIIMNTIFGTFYEYKDINFVDMKTERNIIETEECLLDIDNNRLKAIESVTVMLNHSVLGTKAYSLDVPCKFSKMKPEQLVKFRSSYGEDAVSDFQDGGLFWTCMCGYKNDTDTNKCYLCGRIKGKYIMKTSNIPVW